mgnify:CR=1 FL=1
MNEEQLNTEETQLLYVIKSFDHLAFKLIGKLAATFDCDLDSDHPFGKLIKRSNNLWKGDLDEEYTYRFHGGHVCFSEKVSGQIIDVYVTEKKEYGTFSYSNLKHYVETSSALSSILNTIDTFEKLEQTILSLEEKGFIVGKRLFIYVTFRLTKGEKVKTELN